MGAQLIPREKCLIKEQLFGTLRSTNGVGVSVYLAQALGTNRFTNLSR